MGSPQAIPPESMLKDNGGSYRKIGNSEFVKLALETCTDTVL
jgi:hypothetical protein